MKKLLKIACTLALCFGLSTTNVKAEEESYINITSYSEVYKPTSENGAELTATVVGTVGEDGYLYLIKTIADSEVVSVSGENIGNELEEYKQGEVSYYRVKVIDVSSPATVNATLNCPTFYEDKIVAETNGGNTNSLAYTFKNTLSSTIGKYALTIYVPEENDIVKVNTPAKYENFKLGEDENMLTISVSGKVAVNGSSTISFTYNPKATMIKNMIVWAICLIVGGFVFIDKYRKAK